MDNIVGIFLFAGCLTCLGVISLRNYYNDQKKEYVILWGKVVEQKKSQRYHKGKTSIGYVPVFEYKYNGKVYQTEHRVQSSKYGKGMEIVPASKYREGDTVELRVYIDKPEYAIVNDEKNIKLPLYLGIPLTLLGIGIFVIAIQLTRG